MTNVCLWWGVCLFLPYMVPVFYMFSRACLVRCILPRYPRLISSRPLSVPEYPKVYNAVSGAKNQGLSRVMTGRVRTFS